MTIVYALLYDVGDGAAEISGIYSNLDAAKNALNLEGWQEHEDTMGFWETILPNGEIWYIEAHVLQ
jgi:hypothetical protein